MSNKAMRSGELARLAGVSADTVRYYEKLGILPTSQRTDGGYRIFPPASLERVQLAQSALQLGFSLAEISEVLRARDNGDIPCHRVLNLAQQKLRALDREIEELRRTQAYMRKLIREWTRKLDATRPGSKAMLLQSLVNTRRTKPNNLKRRSRP